MSQHGVRLLAVGFVALALAMATAQDKPAATGEANGAAAPVPVRAYPKRPAEEPARMPKVTCRGDQITIAADNSTLEQILALVKGCTGARIDIPEGASQIRSFEQFGPGPARKVLDDLLSGTPYNYVIQSPEANPQKVDMVLLTMRDTDEKDAAPADLPLTHGRKLWQHMQKFDKPDPSMVNEDGSLKAPEADAAAENDAPAKDASSDANAAPAADASAAAAVVPEPASASPAAQPAADSGSSGNSAQSIQDRIAQMQQMFNQRQQMMKQQSQPQGGSPNN